MNDKREEAKTLPGSLNRLATTLHAVDRELATLDAARVSAEGGETARIEEARALLRRAILALAPESSAATAEETGPGKRRVKIKAESEIAGSSEAVRGPIKAGANSAKPAARGGRAGRRTPSNDIAERGSLLARLGAAAEAAVPPPATEDASTPVVTVGRAGADKSTSGTAERLAQLEAEIADLTERVTAAPSVGDEPVEKSWGPPETAAGDRPASDDAVGDNEDDDDAEITIIRADGAPVEPTAHAGRQSPRIFRESPPPLDEEEAEVEIRGSGVAQTGGLPGTIRVSARTTADVSGSSPRGKWRLFGGSS